MTKATSLPDHLDKRMEDIRLRFLSSLPERLTEARTNLSVASGDSEGATHAVANAYEAIHGICGLAGTVGYPAIGDAARKVDRCLVRAFREKRGLDQSIQSAAENELEALSRLVDATFPASRVPRDRGDIGA